MSNNELILQLILLGVTKLEALTALYQRARSENRQVTDDEIRALSDKADASLEVLRVWSESKA